MILKSFLVLAFHKLAKMPQSLNLGREEPVNKELARLFELRLLAPWQCLPRNHVETMVRRFAFG
ncbi:hypothetical protein X734_24185 [Mesorhizobium sp. L2C084A000]|nr:hypothetical protein X734_24185 [Mesorhizobium sp. L2C084A000]